VHIVFCNVHAALSMSTRDVLGARPLLTPCLKRNIERLLGAGRLHKGKLVLSWLPVLLNASH